MTTGLYGKGTAMLADARVDIDFDGFAYWLHVSKGLAENTIRAYVSDVHSLIRTDVSAAEHIALMRSDGTAPSTIARRVSGWKRWAEWTDNTDLLLELDTIKLPPVPQGRSHPLDGGLPTVRRMIDSCHKIVHKRLLALCGLCGLRVNEAVNVTAADIWSEGSEWWINVRGKGEKERQVPMTAKTAAILRLDLVTDDAAPLVKMTAGGACTFVKRLGRRLLDADVSSHDLRHTYATSVYNKTLDIKTVSELLGHASVTTTMIYIGVSKATKSAAVATLDDDDPFDDFEATDPWVEAHSEEGVTA